MVVVYLYISNKKRRNTMSIYIVRATDDYGTYDYEYGCLEHATEQYNNETKAQLIESTQGNYHLMRCKERGSTMKTVETVIYAVKNNKREYIGTYETSKENIKQCYIDILTSRGYTNIVMTDQIHCPVLKLSNSMKTIDIDSDR